MASHSSIKLIISSFALMTLLACGGSSSDPAPEADAGAEAGADAEGTDESNEDMMQAVNVDPADLLVGVFEDSAVGGIQYDTATQSGITNDAGEFNYVAGEMVTFSIGDTALPPVAAAPLIRPEDIAAGTDDPTAVTTNIARLLQSLDEDGNPDNGISISAEAATAAIALDFSASVEDFANNPNVINLVANSGSSNTALISAEDALAHLNGTDATGSEPDGGSESEGGATDAENNSDDAAGSAIILDLRNSVWVDSSETGCDGAENIVTLTYSNTGLSGVINRAENRGNGCMREVNNFTEMPFAAVETTSGFLFVCGGDALCTIDELNREELIEPGDQRHDCTSNGQPVSALYRIMHEAGTDTFTVYNCQPDDADVFIRQ